MIKAERIAGHSAMCLFWSMDTDIDLAIFLEKEEMLTTKGTQL